MMIKGARSWEQHVGEPLGSMLERITLATRVTYVGSVCVAFLLIGLDVSGAFVGIVSWISIGVVLAAAYASPLVYLRRSNAQKLMRKKLTEAGVVFAGSPPARSIASFQRWLERNGLDPIKVRAALSA